MRGGGCRVVAVVRRGGENERGAYVRVGCVCVGALASVRVMRTGEERVRTPMMSHMLRLSRGPVSGQYFCRYYAHNK